MNCQKQNKTKKNFIQLSLQRQFIWTTDSKQHISAERHTHRMRVRLERRNVQWFLWILLFPKMVFTHGISLKWRVNGIDLNITSCVYMFIKWQQQKNTKNTLLLKQKHCCAIWYVCVCVWNYGNLVLFHPHHVIVVIVVLPKTARFCSLPAFGFVGG